ncbi:MAG TPA: hypothetical protein VMM92_15370 [Thermoanaerobaculia bacterium]|nr:hypothetical protein [Thermoanaerobaculia bacterium]
MVRHLLAGCGSCRVRLSALDTSGVWQRDSRQGAGAAGRKGGAHTDAVAYDAVLARALYERMGESLGLATCCLQSGIVCQYGGEPDLAVQWIDRALRILSRLGPDAPRFLAGGPGSL